MPGRRSGAGRGAPWRDSGTTPAQASPATSRAGRPASRRRPSATTRSIGSASTSVAASSLAVGPAELGDAAGQQRLGDQVEGRAFSASGQRPCTCRTAPRCGSASTTRTPTGRRPAPSSAVTARQVGAPAASARIQREPVEPWASTRSPSRTTAVGITTGAPASSTRPKWPRRAESSRASSAARSVLAFSRSRVTRRCAVGVGHRPIMAFDQRRPVATGGRGASRRGRPRSSPAGPALAPSQRSGSGSQRRERCPTHGSAVSSVSPAGDQVGQRAAGEVRRRHAVADVAAGPRQPGRGVEADRGVPVAGDAERAAPAVRDRARRAAPGTARAACARARRTRAAPGRSRPRCASRSGTARRGRRTPAGRRRCAGRR